MCLIVDSCVVGLVFGDPTGRSEAATKLLEYIDNGKLRLVVGGRLREELCGSNKFEKWLTVALDRGTARIVSKHKVNEAEQQIQEDKCKSNDTHVLALAIAAHARLLYTHDDALADDFKNRDLIRKPRGKVFRTEVSGRFTDDKRKLLDDANCGT